jgi:hypothetical protein
MTQTYLEFFLKMMLGFVCYLGFVICNFHQLPPLYIKNEDDLNSNSSIP